MTKMAWLFIIFLLSATFCNLSEGVHDHKKLTPAVVVGTVYCDTCFQHDTSKNSRFIPGATVAVECSTGDGPRPSFRREAKTNEHGEFRVALPFSVSNNVRKIKRCSVTLISSSQPFCAVSSSLHLKSRKQGDHIQIFSAGFFSFKPENQTEICNQKPRTKDNTSRFGSEKSSEPSVPDPSSSFPPPLEDPPESGNQFHLPHLPRLPPLPQLPPLPSFPGLPLLPPRPQKAAIERKALELKDPDFFFPIIPPFFPPVLPQPPPLIPPVLPQPPPLIPPILPQPPPSPLLPPLPPVPFLTPPPSPPLPALPVPLPPLLPFPPPSSPGFPGIPPASSSTISSKKPSP